MLTTEIQQDTHTGPVTLNPRWLRIPSAVKYSGLSRSRLYELRAQGRIKSICLKGHQSAVRGVRLVDRESAEAPRKFSIAGAARVHGDNPMEAIDMATWDVLAKKNRFRPASDFVMLDVRKIGGITGWLRALPDTIRAHKDWLFLGY
jgi:hypothetical protein